MELRQVMRTKLATRDFIDDPLPDRILYDLLDHARFAPNGGNRQGWRVIVVRDQARKERLAELWDLAQREDHAFYAAGLVPFVASEAYWRNPVGGPSQQPVDLDEAQRTPVATTRGSRPQTIVSVRAPVATSGMSGRRRANQC